MHSIAPDKVENVNITMGFPLTQTPVSSFIGTLAELQTNGLHSTSTFHYKYVLVVLQHPYTRMIWPGVGEIEKEINDNNIFYPDSNILKNDLLFFRTKTTKELVDYLLAIVQQLGIKLGEEEVYADPYSGLYNESVFRTFQTLNRLSGLISTGELELEKTTFVRLLRKLLSTVKIPFHGEPIKGLQVMGVLETRALDFKNLLLLSVNEGFMPGGNSENSFIPEFIRKHFGLNTIEDQDSIYAYYFYRLIQRAESVTLVYNTDKTQMGKAEMSRFMLQMLVAPRLKDQIQRYTLQATAQPWQSETISIEKTDSIVQQLKEKYDQNTNPEAYRLSPTALNTFVSCSFKFYLQYIEGLRSIDEMTDEMDVSVFGSVFHKAAEYLYREMGPIPYVVTKELLQRYLEAPHRIEKLVSKAFNEVYFKKEVSKEKYNGQQLINHKIICHLMKRLIRFDIGRTPFTILGLEYQINTFINLDAENIKVRVGGIIDRLEEKDGKQYIVDYKSSGSAKAYKELDELFEQKDKRAAHILQTFVYASALLDNNGDEAVVPALLYLQQAGQDDYSPVITYHNAPIEDFRELNDDFGNLLQKELSKLFDPNESFVQTPVVKTCEYCDFREMCNR
jgi:Inactivated superfamily I helicase